MTKGLSFIFLCSPKGENTVIVYVRPSAFSCPGHNSETTKLSTRKFVGIYMMPTLWVDRSRRVEVQCTKTNSALPCFGVIAYFSF